MYKVKVDEKLLCFTGSVNGMEYVTDPDVKLVVNGMDSFSFAIYPQHPLYKEIACKVSRVKIWRDSKLLFTEKSRDTVRTCMAYARMTARELWHG